MAKVFLSNEEKEKMLRVLDIELEKRHWGIRDKGTSPGNINRYYIVDYRGLALATGIIRYYYRKENVPCQLFYRGQNQDWELRPSLYRFCKTKDDVEKKNCERERALQIISKCFDTEGEPDYREALAQHYGMPTQFIDVVDHFQTALWFAYDGLNNSPDARQDDSVGYVYVIAAPDDACIIDLRHKPSEWLRPHIQQAFCIRFKKPDADLGRVSKYIVLTFVIPKTCLRLWSNYDNIPHDYFFPSEELDRGAVYWNKAEEELGKAGIF